MRRVGERLALIDAPNGDCIFWDDGCTVYQAGPRQCRTFPFWPPNLATPRAWEETVAACPGAGEGRLYSIGEIRELRRGRGKTGTQTQGRRASAPVHGRREHPAASRGPARGGGEAPPLRSTR